MLSTARRSLARNGLIHRALLAAGDATIFDATALFGAAHFDRILISYALSMIPDWREAIRRATSFLDESGSIHIVDFGDFGGYPAIAQHIQLAWLRRFSVVPISEFETELAILANGLGLTLKTERLFGGYATFALLRRI
jgi:S-adenosylmethionine-diacylgycerolhomoserine-N-methlytransferase